MDVKGGGDLPLDVPRMEAQGPKRGKDCQSGASLVTNFTGICDQNAPDRSPSKWNRSGRESTFRQDPIAQLAGAFLQLPQVNSASRLLKYAHLLRSARTVGPASPNLQK